MIFVLIGIIILVVSFALALVTLSREQTNERHLIESKIEEGEEKQPNSENLTQNARVNKKKEIINTGVLEHKPREQVSEQIDQNDAAETERKRADREPFPWEQNYKELNEIIRKEKADKENEKESGSDEGFSLQASENSDAELELEDLISTSDELQKNKS